jgi:hypothetical protein
MSVLWHLLLMTVDRVPWVVGAALVAMLTAAAHDAWRRRGAMVRRGR